jgi:NTP pyrophosphatase (non-canonical NTP hydrolase)
LEIEELLDFVKWEHQRLIKFYKLDNGKELKHLIALKIMEELGELSECLLAQDSIQRGEKLATHESKIEDEICDVLITLLLLAENQKVDIKRGLSKGIEKRKNRNY